MLSVACVRATRHDIREAAWSVLPLCYPFLPNVIYRLVKVGSFCFSKNLKKEMMLYVSFCKEVESQWASLKQTSEVYFARYHFTTGLPLSVGYPVVNSVILDSGAS